VAVLGEQAEEKITVSSLVDNTCVFRVALVNCSTDKRVWVHTPCPVEERAVSQVQTELEFSWDGGAYFYWSSGGSTGSLEYYQGSRYVLVMEILGFSDHLAAAMDLVQLPILSTTHLAQVFKESGTPAGCKIFPGRVPGKREVVQNGGVFFLVNFHNGEDGFVEEQVLYSLLPGGGTCSVKVRKQPGESALKKKKQTK
jgi:hypothetical protein